MNIAVVGTGKTGSKVVELLDESRVVGPFNTANPVTAEGLSGADVAILFVPGSAVGDIKKPLLDSGIPAVWATTGYDWPGELEGELKSRGVKWLRASNFSLGMNIVRKCIGVLSRGSEVLDSPEFSIHEIHHIHKEDAPSGTALSWKEWLGKEAEITSERKGDIKGIHELTLRTESESIFLTHEAHDRAVFAEGAIWAARELIKEEIAPGFYEFSDIFDRAMKF